TAGPGVTARTRLATRKADSSGHGGRRLNIRDQGLGTRDWSRRPGGGFSWLRDGYVGRHRICDEAFFVRLVVQPFEVGGRGLLRAAGENDPGAQLDARDGELAGGVLVQVADGVVLVAVDDEA